MQNFFLSVFFPYKIEDQSGSKSGLDWPVESTGQSRKRKREIDDYNNYKITQDLYNCCHTRKNDNLLTFPYLSLIF